MDVREKSCTLMSNAFALVVVPSHHNLTTNNLTCALLAVLQCGRNNYEKVTKNGVITRQEISLRNEITNPLKMEIGDQLTQGFAFAIPSQPAPMQTNTGKIQTYGILSTFLYTYDST